MSPFEVVAGLGNPCCSVWDRRKPFLGGRYWRECLAGIGRQRFRVGRLDHGSLAVWELGELLPLLKSY